MRRAKTPLSGERTGRRYGWEWVGGNYVARAAWASAESGDADILVRQLKVQGQTPVTTENRGENGALS